MSRWHLSRPDEIRISPLDGGAAVFNPLSWETHILLPEAARVLEALQAGHAGLDALEAAFAAAGSPEAGDAGGRRAALLALLEDLEELGLVTAEHEPADASL